MGQTCRVVTLGGLAIPECERYIEVRTVAVARGKVRHLAGVLNPVYPQVREEWLHTVQYCIDRDVDAVDFRPSYHLRPQEGFAYGFNPPVLEQMVDPGSSAEAARIIGSAYTAFLREAGELLHSCGRRIGVHVISTFVRPNDENKSPPTTENMEHQWETWIDEIADFVVFRAARIIQARCCLWRCGRTGAGLPVRDSVCFTSGQMRAAPGGRPALRGGGAFATGGQR
jgi:hypothetical protein